MEERKFSRDNFYFKAVTLVKNSYKTFFDPREAVSDILRYRHTDILLILNKDVFMMPTYLLEFQVIRSY